MGDFMKKAAWGSIFETFTKHRSNKPRTNGITMVLDKQGGLSLTEDILAVAANTIDHYKLGFGTSVFFEETILRKKIEMLTSADILVYPGGTLTEAAVFTGRFKEYLQRARQLGFNGVEISDGTIMLDRTSRKYLIESALNAGFRVITEVGKKDPNHIISVGEMVELIGSDLSLGAEHVIVEARESGRGVGICRMDGSISKDMMEAIVEQVGGDKRIIWEAPLKMQQVELINRFGGNVNLGNISMAKVLEVESLRCNLRFDTFHQIQKQYLTNQSSVQAGRN